MKIRCSKCGNEIDDDYKFCPLCGEKIDYSRLNDNEDNSLDDGSFLDEDNDELSFVDDLEIDDQKKLDSKELSVTYKKMLKQTQLFSILRLFSYLLFFVTSFFLPLIKFKQDGSVLYWSFFNIIFNTIKAIINKNNFLNIYYFSFLMFVYFLFIVFISIHVLKYIFIRLKNLSNFDSYFEKEFNKDINMNVYEYAKEIKSSMSNKKYNEKNCSRLILSMFAAFMTIILYLYFDYSSVNYISVSFIFIIPILFYLCGLVFGIICLVLLKKKNGLIDMYNHNKNNNIDK